MLFHVWSNWRGPNDSHEHGWRDHGHYTNLAAAQEAAELAAEEMSADGGEWEWAQDRMTIGGTFGYWRETYRTIRIQYVEPCDEALPWEAHELHITYS